MSELKFSFLRFQISDIILKCCELCVIMVLQTFGRAAGMEQRDYFNGIYIAEDSDGIVYRWLIHRGGLSLLPESDYGTELIDLLDLNIKKFRLAIYEIKKLCKFDVMKGDIIGVDDVNAVLTKSQELARNISNSREVTGELLLAAIANASAITDDHTAMYFLNIMRGAVEALEELPYIVKKIYGLMYDCVEFDDPKEWYEQEIMIEKELFRRRYRSEFINHIGRQQFTKYMQVYFFDNCADYYSYMLIKFASLHKQVRQCRCCGKLFIPINKKNTMYCSRVFNEKGQTCKEIGPKIMSKEKNKSDPMLEEYERVKNKNYKRYDRQNYRSDKFKDRVNEKELSFDEYQEWQQEASAARAEYLNGTLSAEEFGKVINKLG